MENAVDSLKIAFGILIFTVALSISISTFSNAKQAIDSVITSKDKTQEYVYIKPASSSNRDVGIESIIPALYKAYSENYRVEFYVRDASGNENKLILYSTKNHESSEPWNEINYIDLEEENFAGELFAIDHLNTLLTNGNNKFFINELQTYNTRKITDYNRYNSAQTKPLYEEVIGSKSGNIDIGNEGLYEFLKDKKFEEKLGEYYQEDKSAGKETDSLEINKTKKRVITYIWKNY